MSHVTATRKAATLSIPIVRRADGTVRQVVVVEDGEQVFCGYFPAGALRWDATNPLDLAPLFEHRRYHWTDAFTDDELRDAYGYGPAKIAILRLMSKVVNDAKILVHKDDKS